MVPKIFTERDIEIIKLIHTFGKTYTPVLAKTLFNGEQQARNRINKLEKKGILQHKITGLMKPQKAYFLSPQTNKYLLPLLGLEERKSYKIHLRTLNHNMAEQIAYYHLGKVGRVSRTSVYHDKNRYYAVPDLILKTITGNIFVEVEIHQKSKKRYADFVTRASRDNPRAVLFICVKKEFMITIAKSLPLWEKLLFIDVDTLIKNVKTTGKVGAFKQSELI